MNLELVEALWWFGKLPSDRIPGIAGEMLAAGFDSPRLVRLAGVPAAADPDLHKEFRGVLEDLGRQPLSKAQAGRIIARDFARDIIEDGISPYVGARYIWWKVSNECEEPFPELRPFMVLTIQYEDCPRLRAKIEAEIVVEAQRLLNSTL
jgi:hypothetical protein